MIIHQRRRSIRVADGSAGSGDGPGDDRGRGIERLSGRDEIQARAERLLQMVSDKAGVHWPGDRDSPCTSTASSVPESVGISRPPADDELAFPPLTVGEAFRNKSDERGVVEDFDQMAEKLAELAKENGRLGSHSYLLSARCATNKQRRPETCL